MFSGAANPVFFDPDFNAVGHDIITGSNVYNFNYNAALPDSFLTSADLLAAQDQPKRRTSATGPTTVRKPALNAVKRLLGLLAPRRPHAPDAARSTTQIGDATDTGTPDLTPGSSCASSPFGSQEDVTLSSIEDLDTGLISLERRVATTPQEYVSIMSKTGNGLPCYRPQAVEPYSGRNGVVPGDVGVYSIEEGRFKRIFNLLEAARSGTLPFPIPAMEVTTDEEAIPKGHVISEGASSRKFFSNPDKSLHPSYEFNCNASRGAVYVATSAATSEEFVSYTTLRECIERNPQAIYLYANQIRPIPDDAPLYIITGCNKSDSYALAVFKDAGNLSSSDTMCLSDMTKCDADRVRYDWTSRPTSGEAKFGSSGDEGLKNQTLFLRGFKLDFSLSFRHRMKYPPPPGGSPFDGPPHPSDSSRPPGGHEGRDIDKGGRQANGPKESQGSSFNGSQMSSSGRGPTNMSAGNQDGGAWLDGLAPGRDWDRMSVQDMFHSYSDGCHPSDIINQYLLDVTGADFALCHDDEWRFAAQFSDEHGDYLDSATDQLEIVTTSHGVASLGSFPKARAERASLVPVFENIHKFHSTRKEILATSPLCAKSLSSQESLDVTPCNHPLEGAADSAAHHSALGSLEETREAAQRNNCEKVPCHLPVPADFLGAADDCEPEKPPTADSLFTTSVKHTKKPFITGWLTADETIDQQYGNQEFHPASSGPSETLEAEDFHEARETTEFWPTNRSGILVLLLGRTGAGKSHFINTCFQDNGTAPVVLKGPEDGKRTFEKERQMWRSYCGASPNVLLDHRSGPVVSMFDALEDARAPSNPCTAVRPEPPKNGFKERWRFATASPIDFAEDRPLSICHSPHLPNDGRANFTPAPRGEDDLALPRAGLAQARPLCMLPAHDEREALLDFVSSGRCICDWVDEALHEGREEQEEEERAG